MRSSRASKTNEQSKFVHVILTPFRVLGMARDLYVKGIQDCAGRTSHGGVVGFHTVKHCNRLLPKSFGKGSSKSDDEELIRELLRTASSSERSDGFLVEGLRRRHPRCNVGLGRIDENSPSSFEEACGESYGVMKTNSPFYY